MIFVRTSKFAVVLALLTLAFFFQVQNTFAQDSREECIAAVQALNEECLDQTHAQTQFCLSEATTPAEEDECLEFENFGFLDCDAHSVEQEEDCEALPTLDEIEQDHLEAEAEAEAQAQLEANQGTDTVTTTTTPSFNAQFSSIQSQGLIFGNICSSRTAACPCRDTGDCTLNDVLQVVVNIAIFILGISGTVVLAMFVYGGFLWMTSHGRIDLVEQGKKTMTGAIVGLLIIFGSYAAITFLVNTLRFGSTPEAGQDLEDVLSDTVGPEAGAIIDTQ